MTSMLKPSSIGIQTICEPGERYLHFFLTVLPSQDPAEAYSRLAEQVKASGVEPISEKAYGTLAIRSEVLEARRSAFREHGLDADLPLTYLEGRPAAGGEFAGVQLWGIARQSVLDPGVRSVPVPGGTARLWETDYHTFVRWACSHLVRDLTEAERTRYGISNAGPTCS